MIDLTNTYVIAEIGVNHNGSIKLAKDMISAAKAAGANAVKFQTFTAEALVSRGTPKVNYQKETTDQEENQFSMLKKLELSKAMHIELINYSKIKDIKFLSSPFFPLGLHSTQPDANLRWCSGDKKIEL
jgi:sialic acid synthase SpsE